MRKRLFNISIAKNITIILLLASPYLMHAQSISLSAKAFFNQTTFINTYGDEYEFHTLSNYGMSAKFNSKKIMGFEAGIRYERKRDDRIEVNYLIFPFKVLISPKYKQFGLDLGVGIFTGKSLTDEYDNDNGRILSVNLRYQFNSRISFFFEVEHLKGWTDPYSYNGIPGAGPGGGAYSLKMDSVTSGIGVTYRLVDFNKE